MRRCSRRYEEVVALCRDAGVRMLDPLELPDTAPVDPR